MLALGSHERLRDFSRGAEIFSIHVEIFWAFHSTLKQKTEYQRYAFSKCPCSLNPESCSLNPEFTVASS